MTIGGLICFTCMATFAHGLGGGGTLKFDNGDEAETSWYLEDKALNQGEVTTLELVPGEVPAQVYSFVHEPTTPVKFVATMEQPFRLAVDSNNNSHFEANEIYSTSRKEVDFGVFPSVVFPLRIGDTTKEVQIEAHTYFNLKFDHHEVYICKILARYKGEISVGGYTYEAKIQFRSPFPAKGVINEKVILDTNADGKCEEIGDAFFPAQGIGWIDGHLYVVQTLFHGEEAQVTLVPYNAPTGGIEFAGTGFEVCQVKAEIWDLPQGIKEHRHRLYLTKREDNQYELPTGRMTINQLYLKDPTLPDELNRFSWLSCKEKSSPISKVVEEGKTLTLPFGGPLTARAEVGIQEKEGYLRIGDYWYQDQFGHEYRGGYSYRGSTQPGFRIKDQQGLVLYEGEFNAGADSEDCAGEYRYRWGSVEWPSSAKGKYSVVPMSPNPAFIEVSSATFTLPTRRPGHVSHWREYRPPDLSKELQGSPGWRFWRWFR